jgi:hypothetical protein
MPQVLDTSSNAAQIDYWNATAGETWAQLHEPLDRQIEPLGLAAMDAARLHHPNIPGNPPIQSSRNML